MIAKAKASYIRITPRKFRQIIPLVKGRRVEDAIALLSGVNRRASVYAIELLKSALANAKRLHEGIDTANVIVSNVVANPGPMLKRFRAGSMGRASMIKKRTSHILVELDEAKGAEGAAEAAKKGKKARKAAEAALSPETEKRRRTKKEAAAPSKR